MKINLVLLLALIILSCNSKKENNQIKETKTDPIKNVETEQVDDVDEKQSEIVDENIKINEELNKKEDNTLVKKNEEKSIVKDNSDSKNNTESIQTIQENTIVKDIDHVLWDNLLKKNVAANGKVNYKGFIRDKAILESYLDILSLKIPDNNWSKNTKLAYWINVYNAYTVKLIIDNYPLKSIKNISNPWDKKFFTLEGKKYSLEEVENDILRKMDEPRIHFAINCASYSCPNLLNEAYTASSLERQFEVVTKGFVNDASKNIISQQEIKVSEIFNWFSGDFKVKYNSIIDFLNKYSNTKINENSEVKYLEYNWSLNE